MLTRHEFLVENPIDRYTVSQRNKFKTNGDGSVGVYIQNESPGEDKEQNWCLRRRQVHADSAVVLAEGEAAVYPRRNVEDSSDQRGQLRAPTEACFDKSWPLPDIAMVKCKEKTHQTYSADSDHERHRVGAARMLPLPFLPDD
jgi:hypothetical protein